MANANEYGIYVSNSVNSPIVRYNMVANSEFSGIHFNADATQGGPGVSVNALIDSNIVFGNAQAALGGISLDGVQSSLIINNLIFNNGYTGLILYRADASAGSTNNKIINNTIVAPKTSNWAVYIANQSTGNLLQNNILYAANPSYGSIDLAIDSRSGFKSDFNVVTDGFSNLSGFGSAANMTLAQWQSTMQADKHSFTATPASLFVNSQGGDFRLAAHSPAIDQGSPSGAPNYDILVNGRPAGNGFDIGAFEFGAKPIVNPNPNPTPTPTPSGVFPIKLGAKATSGGNAKLRSDLPRDQEDPEEDHVSGRAIDRRRALPAHRKDARRDKAGLQRQRPEEGHPLLLSDPRLPAAGSKRYSPTSSPSLPGDSGCALIGERANRQRGPPLRLRRASRGG